MALNIRFLLVRYLSILTFIGGLLGASGFVIRKQPNAKEIIQKLTPYRGGIGVAMLIAGVFLALRVLLYKDYYGYYSPLDWLVPIVLAAVNIALGFLLGYELVEEYVLNRHQTAKERGKEFRSKLIAHQSNLGVAAMIVSVLHLLM